MAKTMKGQKGVGNVGGEEKKYIKLTQDFSVGLDRSRFPSTIRWRILRQNDCRKTKI